MLFLAGLGQLTRKRINRHGGSLPGPPILHSLLDKIRAAALSVQSRRWDM